MSSTKSPGACERWAILNWRSSSIHPSSSLSFLKHRRQMSMLTFYCLNHSVVLVIKKQKFMLCCFHTLSRGRDGKSWTWFCSRMSRLTSHISHHPVLFRWSAFYSQSDWCRCRSDYTLLTNCARCHSASLITDSIGEWRHRLQCVVDQNGGHTEHTFY